MPADIFMYYLSAERGNFFNLSGPQIKLILLISTDFVVIRGMHRAIIYSAKLQEFALYIEALCTYQHFALVFVQKMSDFALVFM